ncbi:MAG: phosphoribosylanthranilate isomerase [Pyrinomonadaceae bacterium]
MTFVKICGITNLDDALHAIESGADALGFNFYERSPRYIDPKAAREIVDKLPDGVKLVGVFVNKPPRLVASIAASVGLDAVQLHGEESNDEVQRLRDATGIEVIKAFRISPGFDRGSIDACGADAVLLDGFSPTEHGGTGIVADWSVARSIVDGGHRVYLAGGLSAENVADAIAAVRPFAVDACSLLESEKGKKDHDKVRAFIANARSIYE